MKGRMAGATFSLRKSVKELRREKPCRTGPKLLAVCRPLGTVRNLCAKVWKSLRTGFTGIGRMGGPMGSSCHLVSVNTLLQGADDPRPAYGSHGRLPSPRPALFG